MKNSSKPIKVCMISYLHDLYDDRIYWKESIALKKSGFEVSIVGITQTPADKVSAQGIKLIGITKTTKSNFWGKLELLFSKKSVFNEIVRIAQMEMADVYHIHDFQLNRIGPALKRLSHQPHVIYDVHEPFPVTLTTTTKKKFPNSIIARMKRYFLNYWEKKMAAKYDLIITTEDNVAKQFEKQLPGKPVSVIWNYTDLKKTDNINPIFDFIYCGGLMERRGACEMVKALDVLKKRGYNPKLLIIGNIFDKKLQIKMNRFITDNNLSENITIIPHVPYSEIASYYAQSRFSLALFKDIEVNRIIMPIKIFEYIAMNLPVVCSNFGHMSQITTTYQTGLTVNADNVEDICNGMERLLTDKELAFRLRLNCQKAAEEFDWKKMEIKLVTLYNNLL